MNYPGGTVMAESTLQTRLMTAEEFWDFCAGKDGDFSLVNGEVMRLTPGNPEHGCTDSRLNLRLGAFVAEHRLGEVYLNTGFILRRNPDVTRGPDQAFVSAARIRANPPPARGFWELPPDVVVEIVSPGDTADEVQEKVDDYLSAGVGWVWLVYPLRRQVHVIRPGWAIEVLGEEGILEGGEMLPGFRLELKEIWGEKR